ncbi:MAG: hypothetical protein LBE34_10780 [Flavobacteriaceae bacterium]|jgi:hypothetical protein|nr:hypothetical protein [Flavobacteriaceae bacterium]
MNTKDLIERLYTISQLILQDDTDLEAIDNLLEERDDDSFATQWMNEYNAIEEFKQETEYDSLIDTCREKIFKTVYNKTKSPDLSSYICDDFTLFMEALTCEYESMWLNALLLEYKQGKIPKGNITEQKGTLATLILEL